MKKKIVALLTAAMMLVSATTVLAAPSVSAGDLSSSKGNVTNAASMTDAQAEETAKDLAVAKDKVEGAENVTINDVTPVDAATFKATAAEAVAAVKAKFGVDITAAVTGDTKVTAAIVAIMDIKAEITGDKADITVAVPDVKAGETVIVLHQKADGTWEQLPVVQVVDGKVVFTATSFSPIAIVKVASTSVKTGVVSVLPVLAAAGLVGAVVTGKKSKAN
ncbi:MAG: hypothetical protein IKD30_02665 [Peptococcaceae bacterium]|nr:hypothetical protein [Peptococcaceae bacterium]